MRYGQYVNEDKSHNYSFPEEDEVKVVVEKREWGLPQTNLNHITIRLVIALVWTPG